MKTSILSFLVFTLAIATGISEAQEAETGQIYTIQGKEQETAQGGSLVTKTYLRNGKWQMLRNTGFTSLGKERVKSWQFASVHFTKPFLGKTFESNASRMLFEEGTSVFGWYGKKDKSVFDTFYSDGGNNLLVRNEAGGYDLLNQAGLDTVKAKGIVAAIEKRIGQPLAKKKGILVSQKYYVRGEEPDLPLLRCHEVVVELGPDEQEKRYTFFGSEFGVPLKILEWTVNSKSKLSWIDCETGRGGFMFQDSDGDGVYETLELAVENERKVKPGEQHVEIFDVADPWNIKLVPLDSDLFKDANASLKRANGIRQGTQELIDQGVLERSAEGELQLPDQ